MEILKLKKPAYINGEEKTEIAYDFDNLTGEDIQLATSELQRLGIMTTGLEIDPVYNAAIFARAAGLAFTDIQKLSAKDFNKAAALSRVFFLGDSEE